MRFRSPERRKQARQKTAERAAAKLIYRFMTDGQSRYLTYRLSFIERLQFNSLGGAGSRMHLIEQRARRFEQRVVGSMRTEGINVESSLEVDIRTHRLNSESQYLRSCTLTVQRA